MLRVGDSILLFLYDQIMMKIYLDNDRMKRLACTLINEKQIVHFLMINR